MPKFIHFDEAYSAAIEALRGWLSENPAVSEALLITDLFGKLRLVLFPSGQADTVAAQLAQACGPWWTGDVLQADQLDPAMRQVFQSARTQALIDEAQSRLKLVQRHRSRTAWFSAPVEPPWSAPENGPPIIVFYSFKGGFGRSTLLASFAIQRAQAGERVCIIDLDLDSPGAGRLLSADPDGLMASWGAVDFLLEHRMPDIIFDDYWHRCDRVSGPGEIRVMPAGMLNKHYADKLGRIDLEELPSAHESGLGKLLERTKQELEPDWILLDARTGISETAGQLLSGIAHLHVLLGSVQEQSWQGLERVLDRLGKDRVLASTPQAEVVLVQAMVPPGEPGKWARETFAGRAEETFEDRYYAGVEFDADQFWTVDDEQQQEAPHVALPVEYDPRLASFGDIADIAEALCTGSYAEIGVRIAEKFTKEIDA